MAGGHETAGPEEVPGRMKGLLAHDHQIERERPLALDDIIAFHAELETIHPFQDRNGRVGRLVALKECLRCRIVPFLIEDSKKAAYFRGIADWHRENGWLIDTCLDGQDTFRALMDALGVPDS